MVAVARPARVFPAYAGMSRVVKERVQVELCFPRLRGDEPLTAVSVRERIGFSPPTRG